MEITKTFYAPARKEWRAWLKKNHKTEKEIWLVYYNKQSGKPRISYSHAVEEALCFGWIDSTLKKIDSESFAQRFSPRNPKSSWSELNKERARRLIKSRRMTMAGLALLGNHHNTEFTIAADIMKALKKDKETWKNFQQFPEGYKRIRTGFIDASRNSPDFFKKRLAYFLKMTKQNKMFGMVQ
ncbi:MAG: YdeI/OmpD-associated family protein [Bacteroidia bacterium]|nr:YdeI/OmpD-associated family protein [Bacteroidia bacterium]